MPSTTERAQRLEEVRAVEAELIRRAVQIRHDQERALAAYLATRTQLDEEAVRIATLRVELESQRDWLEIAPENRFRMVSLVPGDIEEDETKAIPKVP